MDEDSSTEHKYWQAYSFLEKKFIDTRSQKILFKPTGTDKNDKTLYRPYKCIMTNTRKKEKREEKKKKKKHQGSMRYITLQNCLG